MFDELPADMQEAFGDAETYMKRFTKSTEIA
jgi:hypothetical protein